MATGVELATAYVSISLEGSNIGPDVRRMFSSVETQAGRTGSSAGKRMGGTMGASVLGAVKTFAAPIAAALGTGILVDFVRDAVGLGSDLEQSLGGAQAVFREDFDRINESASNAADNLGISRNAYNELATVLGAGLKNQGIKDFAGTTQELIDLGADLSAQYGGSTKDAIGAIASAMRGESDPIERYGISLNETAVNAHLAKNGLKGLKGEALTQAKAQARVAILTQQAADAQGAFARESDTLAGKQQRLSATWEDMKTQVGTALLPVMTDLADWFLKDGLPAIKEFGGWVRDNLWPALKDGYDTIMPGLTQALDILSGGVGDGNLSWKDLAAILTDKVIPFVADLTNIYLPAAATQIRGTIEVVKGLWLAFETYRNVVATVAAFVLDVFARVTNAGAAMLEALSVVPGFGWAKDAAEKLRGAADEANGLADRLREIPNKKNIDVNVAFTSTGQVSLGKGVSVDVGQYRARAAGGPVRPGGAYVVGENGPELLTMGRQSGGITPNHKLGGGDGVDYLRLGDAVAGALRKEGSFSVGVAETSRKVSTYQNRRKGL